ncbi:MAG: hypothetical protein LBC05_00430 [Endomicrobium sp.]|jgi:ABC-type glycerol-3-phosphate transport system substrate-binding protein|nr:hypothetical protein [Endomicrobium sp.]
MKKIMLVGAFAVMLGLGLVACGTKTESTKESSEKATDGIIEETAPSTQTVEDSETNKGV